MVHIRFPVAVEGHQPKSDVHCPTLLVFHTRIAEIDQHCRQSVNLEWDCYIEQNCHVVVTCAVDIA